MTLTLRVENVPSLASGDPVEMVLAEHGLVIGRAAHADWTLPDPANHVSSIHCEIDYRDGRYLLTDRSTNGTFVNGSPQRPSSPVELRDGDLLAIGHYQIRVAGGGAGAAGAGGGFSATANPFGGIDWAGSGGGAAAPAVSQDRFGREAPRPLFQSGNDPLMAAFAPPKPQSAPAADPFGVAGGSGFGTPGGGSDPFGLAAPASPAPFAAPPAADPFGTPPVASDPFGMAPAPAAAPPSPPPASDPFGMGTAPAADPFGMAASPPPAAADPFGMASPAPPSPPPPAAPADNPWAALGGGIDFGMAPPAPPPAAAPTPAPAPARETAPAASSDALYARLLAAMGLEERDMGGRAPEQVVDAVGGLLRRATMGLFRLLEARTRVRHQFGVGAQVTTFQRDGNNPLKWTRSPEEALKQMAGAPARGFLEGDKAVQGAFEDLQAHEMAMIAAMQEAMAETIRRFAPDSIRQRISAKGWLKSVLPGSREATLWRAYESEFTAFADESEAAYLDLFARQFKKAYERIVSQP